MILKDEVRERNSPYPVTPLAGIGVPEGCWLPPELVNVVESSMCVCAKSDVDDVSCWACDDGGRVSPRLARSGDQRGGPSS